MEKDTITTYKTQKEKIENAQDGFVKGVEKNYNKNKKNNQKNQNNDSESHYAVFLNQKIKKLTTALYVVSDFLSDNEPIKWKLREASVNLIGHIGAYNLHSPLSERVAVERVFLGCAEIISLLEIAFGARLISEMNFSILRTGYAHLSRAIKEREGVSGTNTAVVPENFFQEKRSSYSDMIFFDTYRNRRNQHSPSKEISSFTPGDAVRASSARGPHQFLSRRTTPADSIGHSVPVKDIVGAEKDIRQKRKEEILRTMSFSAGEGMNIKDISGRFPHVGEKTIQRDLMEMLKEGKVSKAGERRWSKYSVVRK